MKKTLTTFVLLSLAFAGFAKKVKFAVDMDTITPNITGIHIGGDFQTLAGYAGGDWASGTTPMTQEGSTSIYSVIVDIPAFAKYEFKFINGDQWYDAEFVPIESRVDPMSDDNRWLYVDSLANDTTFAGAIIYSTNAPRGLTLMRYFVDMTNESSLDPAGVHVAGDFQGWSPVQTRMYSFGSGIYQIIAYGTNLTYSYRFYNGNTSGATETVPGTCAVGGNRQLILAKDSVLDIVCFGGCSACAPNGIAPNKVDAFKLFPNPANDHTELILGNDASYDVSILDHTGKTVRVYTGVKNNLRIDSKELARGMYFITADNKVGAKAFTLKFIVE